jgi:cytochrome c oxidase assembly protein subunit 15
VLLDHRARTHSRLPSADEVRGDSWQLLRVHSWSMVFLTSVIITLGTLVTGSGPHTGSQKSGEPIARLGFDIREITRLHSGLIWLFAAVLLWGLWTARDRPIQKRHLMRIFGLATFQGVIGYLQYFTGVPVLLVALHITGSVLLFATVVRYAAEAT